jgi:hypothetical protein
MDRKEIWIIRFSKLWPKILPIPSTPNPRYIHTFLLFLFILTTCCFYESGLENCGFGTSAVSRNYVQIQNFKFWDWRRVGFNSLFKLDCLTCYVNFFLFFIFYFILNQVFGWLFSIAFLD